MQPVSMSNCYSRGVIVRPVANYDLPNWLRITIGLPDENDRFVQALIHSLEAVAA